MLCPRCELQYLPNRTQCSECGFELAAGDVAGPAPPGSEIVVVFEGHLDEAEAAQAAMAIAGIESQISSQSRRGVSIHHGLSQLQVRAEDEDAAKEALCYPNG